MPATTIPSLTGEQFAARIADLFPRGWCSEDARQGGNVHSLLLSVGNELRIVQQEVQYALAAQRIGTSTFPELDFASIDFLGNAVPRGPGQTDGAFAAGIIAALFKAAATRPALQNALAALTGYVPRMLEPWSVVDTGAWRNRSYWNVDTISNPARWGNGGLRYQGFIEAAPPSIPAIGANNPIRCWGDSAYWNQPGYFFGIIPPINTNAINDTVNNLRAYGTTVWVKLVAPGVLISSTAPSAVTGLSAASAGTSSIRLSWIAPVTGTPPYTFSVIYRQSGTTAFTAGPTVTAPSATVISLAAHVSYDFAIIARNVSGSATSGTVTATTASIAPSPARNLIATQVQATAVTLAWQTPATGTPPFVYSVNYRVTGTTIWQNLVAGQGALTVTVVFLIPDTSYDFEVVTVNT